MKYTDENVMTVAQKIVDGMDLKDLMNYVYDDLCAIMDKDEELFNCNVENFVNNKPEPKEGFTAALNDWVDDHRKHFGAYPAEFEYEGRVWTMEEYMPYLR